MYNYENIKEIHLEITQRCNASCPMCDRNENGGVVNKHIRSDLQELTLDDCIDIFPADFVGQLKNMYMCGNLGDPISAKDTLEVFDWFRACNDTMWLSMNTNAGARTVAWWQDLAKTIGKHGAVIFSVDGLKDTNHLYRQGVHWDLVERNMRAFINAGGRARWDYLIFEHNEHQVEEAEALAKEWGVEKFMKKKTGRFFSSVQNKGKDFHQSRNRKGEQTQVLAKPRKLEHQNLAIAKEKEIQKTYGSMMEYYNKAKIDCKVAGPGNLFITAEGLVMPCCWVAGRMYKWWHDDHRAEQVWDFIDRAGGKDAISAKLHGIKHVFNTGIMQDIQRSWKLNSIKEGKLGVCSQKCGTEFDPFGAQFS
jgi:MoaA/NifB/PqqE/SkfB family radical SAM enzyme